MKFIVAPDTYKECLSAERVAEAMKSGIMHVFPNAEVVLLPLADGGEGTVNALVNGLNGKRRSLNTVDMYLRPIETHYGVIDAHTAVIEVASIIGMEVSQERNPYLATSYGVGDVIGQLIDFGFQKILVGLGGSLTNDGGAGLLEALGVQYFRGNEVIHVNGGNLNEITHVDVSQLNPKLQSIEIHLISDVSNPLLGENGATYTFGKQKGINDGELKLFEQNIVHYSDLLETSIGKHHIQTQGAGAAGGIGYGLLMLGANMMPGAAYIIDLLKVELHLQDADYLITGEGMSDFQTAYGKLPSVIAKRANAFGVNTILISGSLGKDYLSLLDDFISVQSIMTHPMTLQEAMQNASKLIQESTQNTCHMIKRLER